jgi:hypothetical protein
LGEWQALLAENLPEREKDWVFYSPIGFGLRQIPSADVTR